MHFAGLFLLYLYHEKISIAFFNICVIGQLSEIGLTCEPKANLG